MPRAKNDVFHRNYLGANLSRGMRHLNGVYTQRNNKNNQRVGHAFQGRFKAIIVDGDNYLLVLARYIVLNNDQPSPWESLINQVILGSEVFGEEALKELDTE